MLANFASLKMCNQESSKGEEQNSNVFESLDRFAYVIFYENMGNDVTTLIKHVDPNDYTLIKLSSSEEVLRSACFEHFKPEKLPFILYRNSLVYPENDIFERFNEIDESNIKKYTDFINDFVLKQGLTIFMKGTVANPKCKFSRQLATFIVKYGLKNVKDFDILTDPLLRHYMKKIMEWPTFPQVFINGEFYGGLDSFVELCESGELQKLMQ